MTNDNKTSAVIQNKDAYTHLYPKEWAAVRAKYMRMEEALQRCSEVICAAKMGDIPVVTLGQKGAKTLIDDALAFDPLNP